VHRGAAPGTAALIARGVAHAAGVRRAPYLASHEAAVTRPGDPKWGARLTLTGERARHDGDDITGDAAAIDEADRPTAAGTENGPVNRTKLLTVKEAADLRGVSPDTVSRAIKAGHYPGATRGTGPNDPWLIPLSDLIAAGHYDPASATVEPEVAIRTTRAERELADVNTKLAKADAEVESLRRELGERDKQLHWLRKHVTALTASRKAA
jgi:hypothetical protein